MVLTYPGRRFALPWANILSLSGRLVYKQQASSLSVKNEKQYFTDRLEAYPTNTSLVNKSKLRTVEQRP